MLLVSSEGCAGAVVSCVGEAHGEVQGGPGLCDHGLESQSPMSGRNFEIQTYPCHLISQKGKLRASGVCECAMPRGFTRLVSRSSQWLGGS